MCMYQLAPKMNPTPQHQIANMDGPSAMPRLNGELVFAAPWEARAFGMAVVLNENGVYEWRAFSQGLAAEIAAAEQHGVDSSYYERWLASLEKLVTAAGLVTPEELDTRTADYACGARSDHEEHHDQSSATHGMAPHRGSAGPPRHG